MKSSPQSPAAVRPPSEQQFMRTVIELAEFSGWRCYHPWLSLHSASGWPDLVLVRPGDPVLYVELKSTTGKLTTFQRSWLNCLSQALGTEVHLWRPSDWDAIEARLLRHRRRG